MHTESTIEEKLELTKACIHCGMCLPACPTYLVTSNEGNSPRGRLYMIRDFIESEKNGIAPNNNHKSIDYLDYCLSCRACETACPSGVEYGSILEYIREEKHLNEYNLGLGAWIRRFAFKFMLPNRRLLSWMRKPIHIINFIYKLFPFLPKISKIQPNLEQHYKAIKTNHTYRSQVELNNDQINFLQNNFANFYSNNSQDINKLRTITLPIGCVMDTIYNHVHWETVKLLNALGFHVFIPSSNCCGALASHSGEPNIGHSQLKAFFESLGPYEYPVIWNSAGCGAYTKDHAPENFKSRIFDLIEIVNQAPIKITSLLSKGKNAIEQSSTHKLKITYHPACHLNHAQGLRTEYLYLLKQIPDLEIIPLYEADVCCGSAGFYNLIKSKMAESIGERKAHFIKETGAKIIITANPGCMSQIQAHLGEGHKVMHPVSLLMHALQRPLQL